MGSWAKKEEKEGVREKKSRNAAFELEKEA